MATKVLIVDDIDWEALSRASRREGGSSRPPTSILFSAGVSTRESVSEISGRGIGLGALRAACERVGATIQVDSSTGSGTSFRFCLPTYETKAA